MSKLPMKRADMLAALQATKSATAAASEGGAEYLKFSRAGEWTYGAEEVEVHKDSAFVLNVGTIARGFIAWGDGEVLGEQMATLFEPPVVEDELPEVGARWDIQIGFELLCISGEDKDAAVRYKTTSRGGLRACNQLITKVIEKIQAGEEEYLPAVKLGTSSYTHKKYGRIYTPVLDVVGWYAEDDSEAKEPEPEPEPEKIEVVEEKPKRRRLRR